MSTGSDRLFDPGAFDVATPAPASPPTVERRGPEPGERIIRVLPDVSGLEREFDYVCPARWAEDIAVGSLVRFDLNRRRVAGWVTEVDITPTDVDVDDLVAITKISSIGPPADVVDLARWAARQWHGRLAPVLRAASPHRMVRTRPASRAGPPANGPSDRFAGEGIDADGWLVAAAVSPEAFDAITCLEVSPDDDMIPMLEALHALGDCLVIVPDVRRAHRLAGRLRRHGVRVHLQPNQWSGGFSGGVVVGARSAVWAPVANLRSVVVLDEHDESLQAERVPTWHARDVAIERARRAGARCLLVSPVPSLTARHLAGRLIRAPRSVQRHGWPITEVVDRRRDELGFSNLFSSRLVEVLRGADTAVLVLNRKGRARLLACRSCGELVRTEDGHQVMIEDEGGLVAPATGERRPLICASCAGTALKRLQLGVGRAAEQLSRLLGRPVTEVTGTGGAPDGRTTGVILGTEAALHAVDRCDVVGFLDFDQELLAPRYRAGEQALALMVLAARLVGGRGDGGRVVIQTRVPDHRVVRAVVAGDPERFAEEEAVQRAELGFPPSGALAELSGVGAASYAAALVAVTDADPDRWAAVRLLGPRHDDRYLISVPTTADEDPWVMLADLLAAIPRPKQRVRIAVDPPRV
ncbi:MAG: hypothetical protein OES24_20590 [Acidimicrobiia bacterium]|nr:hypothetical protein [Acidimicrobiia bacterium]